VRFCLIGGKDIAAATGGQVDRYFGGIGKGCHFEGGQIVERLFDRCFDF